MVGRCSRRSDLTPRRGGLMTNWCSSSIIVSTLPTPLGLLNGSILLVAPLLPPSCSLSLSSNISFFPFSLYRVCNNPPPTPTHPDHSVCLCRGRHRGSLIALYCHKVKFITLTAPTHTAYFEPAEIRFLYLLGWHRDSFTLSRDRKRDNVMWEKVRGSSAGTDAHCDAPAGRMKT